MQNARLHKILGGVCAHLPRKAAGGAGHSPDAHFPPFGVWCDKKTIASRTPGGIMYGKVCPGGRALHGQVAQGRQRRLLGRPAAVQLLPEHRQQLQERASSRRCLPRRRRSGAAAPTGGGACRCSATKLAPCGRSCPSPSSSTPTEQT